jgi:uncharacterized protein YjbI with pentapeptide repeats
MGERRKVGKKQLERILRRHYMWLREEEGGERAELRNCNLRDADLSGVDLSGAVLEFAELDGADLSNAQLFRAFLRGVRLCKAKVSDANLCEADLSFALLNDADLRGAKLTNSNLGNTYLRGANLEWAGLIGAKLPRADLVDAYLRRADLSSSYLRDSKLWGADLSDADLSDADLCGADLSGAVLTDTRWNSRTRLANVILDDAILPPGFPVPGATPNEVKSNRIAAPQTLITFPEPPASLPERVRQALRDILTGPRKQGDGRYGLRVLRLFVQLGSLRATGNGDNRTSGKVIERLEKKLGIDLKIPPQERGPACVAVPTDDARVIVGWLDQHRELLAAIDVDAPNI